MDFSYKDLLVRFLVILVSIFVIPNQNHGTPTPLPRFNQKMLEIPV
jgi:hypothetical protein